MSEQNGIKYLTPPRPVSDIQREARRNTSAQEVAALMFVKMAQIIDSVNQASVNKDRESHACIASEILSRYSLEDILDWHLIFGEYSSAAYRYDLWVASATIGAHYTDDGFIDFRSWLISRGKEIYMNALRDPNSLAAVPLNGEEPNFERFGYVAYHAYEAKLSRIDPDRPEDLFKALCTHPMDPQTKAEIQSELPQRPDISMEEFNRLIAKVSRRASKNRAPKTISELLNTLNVAFGYVYEGNQRTEYVFYNTPENIANFIGRWPGAAKIIVTDTLDRLIVNTIGNFIDRCPDQDLLQEIKETLLPIQMGEAEAQPFFCPTRDEVDEYCSKVRMRTCRSTAPNYREIDDTETEVTARQAGAGISDGFCPGAVVVFYAVLEKQRDLW